MLSKSAEIEVGEPRISIDRSKYRISFELNFPRKLERFFASDSLFVEYDKNIQGVTPSILYIPVVSNIVTVAWAVGADIYVRELDRTFLKSLDKVKMVMKQWYPRLPFSTTIRVRNIVSNRSKNEKVGLLFSGGIDSTTSYLRHRSEKPILIMIRGADVPLGEKQFWSRMQLDYQKFARQEKVKVDFVSSNMRELLNEKVMHRVFGKHMISWWGGFQHGISLLSLCAPLTLTENMGILLIAASGAREFRRRFPWGSHPLIDEKMAWADTKIVHDSSDLSRQDKIRRVLKGYLKNYMESDGTYPYLRVCYEQFSDYNCGRCEKCRRTIAGLVLENIDPNKCGFSIDDDFFSSLDKYIMTNQEDWTEGVRFIWRDIQAHTPETIDHNLYDSKPFYEWLKDYEIPEFTRKIGIRTCLEDLYSWSPKKMRRIIEGSLKVFRRSS